MFIGALPHKKNINSACATQHQPVNELLNDQHTWLVLRRNVRLVIFKIPIGNLFTGGPPHIIEILGIVFPP